MPAVNAVKLHMSGSVDAAGRGGDGAAGVRRKFESKIALLENRIPSFHAVAEHSKMAQRRDPAISKATPQGGHAMTASLPAYALIPLPGEGPEDVVVGPDGVIYTGLPDGRVLAGAPEDEAVREVSA